MGEQLTLPSTEIPFVFIMCFVIFCPLEIFNLCSNTSLLVPTDALMQIMLIQEHKNKTNTQRYTRF